MSVALVAYLRGGDPEDAPEGAAALGFTAAALDARADDALVARVLDAGLDLVALVAGPGEDPEPLRARADAVGAWMVWAEDGDPPLRRVGDPEALEALRAASEPPEAVLFVGPGDSDPGPARDPLLEELAELLLEREDRVGLALRGRDHARLQALHRLASGVLEDAASWWDGSEDGY